MFLSIASLLAILEIPLFNDVINMEFSLIAVFISRRYIGLLNSVIICFVYPWFSIFGPNGNPVGALFLLLQSIFVLFIDYIFNKNNYSFLGIILVIILGTIWSMIINGLVIAPIFTGGFDESLTWMIIALIFNPFKFLIIYLLTLPLYKGLEKTINSNNNEEGNLN
ncbi:MAG: hypothetical protein TYPL_1140 [Candidatus Tyloplasma litorale]|nr:MAG: hypothetical protein TYPL_1140 [Mycoplasmatales bacterium]